MLNDLQEDILDGLFLTPLARLGLTGAYAQVSVGWKEIYASGGAFFGY
jgi:hypothetical protein